MPRPTLTPAQIEFFEKDLTRQNDIINSTTAAIPVKQEEVAELEDADAGLKSIFDYYNDSIIGRYDQEYRALNGRLVLEPIVEADITNVANVNIDHRTFPDTPNTDLKRISEFDGGGTSNDGTGELSEIERQLFAQQVIATGLPSQSNISSANTSTTLDASSTSLTLFSATIPSIIIGSYILVQNGTDVAVVQILNFVTTSVLSNYSTELDIEVILPPANPIGSGSSVDDDFGGFNDTERNLKVTGNQDLMDYLVGQIESAALARLAFMSTQQSAINLNEDSDGAATLTLASSNISTSTAFIQNYLINTDVSDTGLTSSSAEMTTRQAQIAARILVITNAYTGQSENYYDQRYNFANARGSLSFGMLRRKISQEEALVAMNGFISEAQERVVFINEILA